MMFGTLTSELLYLVHGCWVYQNNVTACPPKASIPTLYYSTWTYVTDVAVWRCGNGVGRINEVTPRRARLVLRWVPVRCFIVLGM